MKIIVGEVQVWHGSGVALAFLDPPYNTGKVFDTYSDRMADAEWQDMLTQAFIRVREALLPDGSVWVTIGGANTLAAWTILDRVFGRECFVANIPWRRNYKATNSRSLSTVHDTILVYGRTPKWTRRRGNPPPQSQQERYRNTDNDPNGPWRLTHAGARVYLKDLIAKGAMPVTWFDYPEYGHNEQATSETQAVCGSSFSYAKPVILVQRIMHIASDPGDLVVDTFAGSGTTLVAAASTNRHCIGIEKSAYNVREFIIPRLQAMNVSFTVYGNLAED